MIKRNIKITIQIYVLAIVFLGISKFIYADESELYKVGIGDTISISVLDRPELSESSKIISDGTIPFYFLGSIYVEGLTLVEIKTELVKQLSSKHLDSPQIVVRLVQEKQDNFYVYGEVRNPGVYRLDDGITVLKAISMAGGLGLWADKKKVKVRRATLDRKQVKDIIVNLNKVVDQSGAAFDVEIKPNDIIIVMKK